MTIGRLTASIAHEINQPLAGIASNGAAGLNWLNRKKPDRDQARDAFSRIVRDSARASVVIRGLWASSRSSVHNWPLDIDDVIESLVGAAEPSLRRWCGELRRDSRDSSRRTVGTRRDRAGDFGPRTGCQPQSFVGEMRLAS